MIQLRDRLCLSDLEVRSLEYETIFRLLPGDQEDMFQAFRILPRKKGACPEIV